MPLSRSQKEELVVQLVEKMKEAKSVVFAKYTNIPVTKQSEIRRLLQKDNAELKVIKKSLIRLAAKEMGIPEIDNSLLEGQIVVAFSYGEATTGPQIIKKQAKNLESLDLLGGIYDGKLMNTQEVQAFADLPPKEVLLAQLLGALQGPISGFTQVSNGVISGFARVLNAHKENLENAA